MTEMLEAILAIVQHDPCNRGLRRDPVQNLITATASDFAAACHCIADHPDPRIGIVTGFTIPSSDPPCGETDGPLGALYLARAFVPLGIPAVIASDGTTLPAMRVGVDEAKLDAPVIELPDQTGEQWRHFEDCNILIAIERVGPAADGRCYSMRGLDMTQLTRPAHRIFENAPPGVATIGIGDGGNEIGMGKLTHEIIRRNIHNGNIVACRTPTHHLIVAGISNWGAYALASGVRLLKRISFEPNLFDCDYERHLLRTMVAAGPLIDGVTHGRQATVDGLGFDDYVAPLKQIGQIVSTMLPRP